MPKLGWTQIFSSIAWKMTKFYSYKVQCCHSSKTGLFQPTKFYYCSSERCVGWHVDFRKNFIKQNRHHFSQLKFGIYDTISYLAPKSLYQTRNLVGWNSVISPEFTAVLDSYNIGDEYNFFFVTVDLEFLQKIF